MRSLHLSSIGVSSRVLFVVGGSLLFGASSSAAQTVQIKLLANETLATVVGYDDTLYFEPYLPAPPESTSCSEECPCGPPGETVCGCDLEMVCSGTIPIDLSVGNKLSLRWDASMTDNKVISITGDERTRVEFRAHIKDCEMPYQDLSEDITFELDDTGLGATQKYTYNAEGSFLSLGTCVDGCARECDIYTRLQFDPDETGVLDMQFKSITISANYDPQKVEQGELPYEWATNSYIWIRKPEGGDIRLVPAPTSFPTSAAPTTRPSKAALPDNPSPVSSSDAPSAAPVKVATPEDNPVELSVNVTASEDTPVGTSESAPTTSPISPATKMNECFARASLYASLIWGFLSLLAV